MGFRKRPTRSHRDPVVQGAFWTALLPGYPYRGQGPYLHFIVIKIGWPLVAGPTTSGLWVPAFSTPRFLVLFDMTRIIDAADRYAVYDIQSKSQVPVDARLRKTIDADILPAVARHRYEEQGQAVLVDIAALLPHASGIGWFQAALDDLDAGTPTERRLAARVRSTLANERGQRVRVKVVADTIARYNRGYLQWASRNLKGDSRDASIVAHALQKAEGRKVKWSAAEQNLVLALYRKVFDEPLLERLLDRSIFDRPPNLSDDKLKEGFLMDILELVELAYCVRVQP